MSYTETADEKHRTPPGTNAHLIHFAGTDVGVWAHKNGRALLCTIVCWR